jgi:phage gp29-like protein
MGSGVANLHADTLSRIIRYHADALADSLTTDFVRVVAEMLGAKPEMVSSLRFQFAPERPDQKERLEAIQAFITLGGKVSEREVRDLLGLSEPSEDEKTLGGAVAPMPSEMGSSQNQIDEWLSKSPPPQEGAEPLKGSPKSFASRSWW